MRESIKRKWIHALRSGSYKQGKYTLRDIGNNFCCLGVLCDVVDPDRWEYAVDYDPDAYFYDNQSAAPPERILLDSFSRNFLDDFTIKNGCTLVGKLISMNDHQDKSFIEIADWIEEHL